MGWWERRELVEELKVVELLLFLSSWAYRRRRCRLSRRRRLLAWRWRLLARGCPCLWPLCLRLCRRCS